MINFSVMFYIEGAGGCNAFSPCWPSHDVLSGYSILICVYCQCVGVAAEVAWGPESLCFPGPSAHMLPENSLDFYPLVLNIVAVVGGRKPGLSSPLRCADHSWAEIKGTLVTQRKNQLPFAHSVFFPLSLFPQLCSNPVICSSRPTGTPRWSRPSLKPRRRPSASFRRTLRASSC